MGDDQDGAGGGEFSVTEPALDAPFAWQPNFRRAVERGNRDIEDRLNRMYPGKRPEKRSPWTNFQGLHNHEH